MTKGQYKIGQVLFIVPKDRAAVVPVQVTEEVLRKSLDGEAVIYTVSWKVGGGKGPEAVKVSELSKIAGEVFDNPVRLKRTLLKRSASAIDGMVKAACKKAEAYGFKEQAKLPRPEKAAKDDDLVEEARPDDPVAVEVDNVGEFVHAKLEDGTKVRVRM